MTDATGLRDRYAVVGIGLSRFGKVPGTSAMGFCLESAKRAIEDCGIARDEIDGVLVLMPPQMGEHGITSTDYGHIAVQWRKHAATNPDAQVRKPMTLEDHQNSRLINAPLHLFDCCLFTDGGGAFIVTSTERARDLKQTPALI